MLRSMITDVDDLAREKSSDAPHGSHKLQHAKEVARRTEEELGALCRGLNDKITELGIEIQRANEYHGVEWAYHVLGAAGLDWAHRRANVMRHRRLENLDTEQAVTELGKFVLATIEQLGESETEYEQDQEVYERKLTEVLAKQREATPLYLRALEVRQALNTEVAILEAALQEVAIADRPDAEGKFEAKKRALDAAKLDEATYLAVVKNAQEAIPELQKSRDAATKAIQSLHGMRQSMLEKFANFKIVLERATTAMRARAHIELFENTDPAFNAAISAITQNNVSTAGAALEVWAERIKQAAIDPKRSQELLNELLQHITDAAMSLQETETVVAAGARPPLILLEDSKNGRLEMEPETVHLHADERQRRRLAAERTR